MAPHRHPNSRSVQRNPKFEQLQADHELFLQAFEKPTQIYRFLRTRNQIAPIFLHRTLSYMPQRCQRTNNNRKSFETIGLLEKVETKLKRDAMTERTQGEYMNLFFKEFHQTRELTSESTVTVEAVLLKVCHKRRKDISSPIKQMFLGKQKVPVNSDSMTTSDDQLRHISVPSSTFSQSNGQTAKSFILLLKVHGERSQSKDWSPGSDNLCNGDVSEDQEEQPSKRRRLSRNSSPSQNDSFTYSSELVVLDKDNCQLTNGDYEVALQEVRPKVMNGKHASWEMLMDGKPVAPFESFKDQPTLKFHLKWSETALRSSNHLQPTMSSSSNHRTLFTSSGTLLNNSNSQSPEQSGSSNGVSILEDTNGVPSSEENIPHKSSVRINASKRDPTPATAIPPPHVFYQFLYNNNTRQQTEARDNMLCPWCSVNCLELYSLLKHLTTCHSRFNFTYVPCPNGARIDVTINEHYDGSYAGNPQNLTSHTGYAFHRNGPCRRSPVTQILVIKHTKRPLGTLTEFQEGENKDYLSVRPQISGHNRMYYHTHSLQPIRPQEMEVDSEDEIDPLWLQQRTRMMIDEFTDVNEGEKELMKLWNLHCMQHNFIADSHIPLACQLFIEERGRQLLELNLYRNFMLHVINMYDFSLISPSVVVRTLLQLDRLNDSMAREGAKEVMKEEKVDMVGGVGTSEEDAEVAGLVQDTTEGVGES
ncbi:polycomb protein suz12-A-like isoform X1 [Asterias rubens]|uniref:polycomb protein suz12-A-like isoform X1 n=1 Tax=Asterias rubens TaxID=7604 RepID=UPI00145544B4|nr:polycomb protein suz12-A-like isoform X1 [Asterias rubens]XP_033630451.1 polycomb protein suz12-A-like isoform X1 [Asterias rubens]